MSEASRFDRVVTVPLRRPAATIVMLLLVTGLAAVMWPAVRFEPDVSRVLPAGHPQVRIAELLDERSRPSRTLWLLLEGEQLEEVVPALAARLAASPDVVEVITTRTQMFARWSDRYERAPLWQLDDEQLEALGGALSADGLRAAVDDLVADLADDPVGGRELALRDPLGLRWLLRAASRFDELGFAPGTDLLLVEGQKHALVQLRGKEDAYDADFSRRICEFIEGQLRELAVTAEVFGGYAVARADQARIRGDFERASTWSVLWIALYLVWVMRGVRLPMLVQLPAMLSIAWAIPFGSACFGALPTVAVAAVAVLCGLGVDFAIHYAARYRHARLMMAHGDAVQFVQRTTVPELLIDMATTAVTFLAIGAGSAGGLRAFGLLLAFGLFGSVMVTVFVLPILLRFAGDRRDPERSIVSGVADRWLDGAGARPVAWAMIGLALVGAAILVRTGIPLSAQTDSLRPQDDPVALAREAIENRIGFATAPALVVWPEAEDASPLLGGLRESVQAGDLRFWSGLESRDTAAGRAAVAACRARADGFVARARKELERVGLDPAAFDAALLRLEQRFATDSEPIEKTLLDYDGRPHRVVTLWPQRRLRLAEFDALQERLETRVGQDVVLHGGPSLLAAMEDMLRRDLWRACWIAALLAVVMVTVWLRSLRDGLLALVPSAMGLVVTLLGLQLLGVSLSMVSFVAVPFVLGIGVDEGVHLVGHYRHMQSGSQRTTGATGVGIVRTSLGTVLGFSALLLAESPGLQLLGGIVACGSVSCMLGCLFVLAPLLARRARS